MPSAPSLVAVVAAVVAVWTALADVGSRAGAPTKFAALDPRIKEASGLFPSGSHEGVFWTHGDSFNPPHLFAVNRDGQLLATVAVKNAGNLDWEALTGDRNGSLFIGDVGNNFLERGPPVRTVFKIKEPKFDPAVRNQQLAAVPMAVFRFTYPGKPFDIEGMVYAAGSLYFTSKERQAGKGATLYRLRGVDEAPKPGAAPTKLEPVGELPETHMATDAALSADGKRFAVVSYRYAAVWKLDGDDPHERMKSMVGRRPQIVRFPPTSVEGCTWSGDELLMVEENGNLLRIDGWD